MRYQPNRRCSPTWRTVLMPLTLGLLIACSDAPVRSTTPNTTTPCGGSEVTLEMANQTAPYDVLQPQTALANPENLKSIWQCATAPDGFLLVYNSGVGVLESLNTLKDPSAEWKGLADSYKEFSVGEINGVAASFADPAVNDAIGGVDFVFDDVRYTISGDGNIPLDELIVVASSIPVATAPQQ
jgi:hypothetical protein